VFEQLGSAGPFCNTGERVHQGVGMCWFIRVFLEAKPSLRSKTERKRAESTELEDTGHRSRVFPSVNSRWSRSSWPAAFNHTTYWTITVTHY